MYREAKFIGINRHRLTTDGKGVTTLAAFHGCPLQCEYCLNPQSWRIEKPMQILTTEEFYNQVKIDNLYFLATNGGITFGGGEPLLHVPFINEYFELFGKQWTMNIETSLYVSPKTLQSIYKNVHEWIIDIKDLNPEIYFTYTKKDNKQVLNNLKFLLSKGLTDKMIVRVPLIPHYNTEEDTQKTIEMLHKMGVTYIDQFDYMVREQNESGVDSR
jgi:pyruvate formate lyase activating enzyme